MEEYVLVENRGYGLCYAKLYGTKEECQKEKDKILSNHYGDLNRRCDGNGTPWCYAVCSKDENWWKD
jgi:hypothetical protein